MCMTFDPRTSSGLASHVVHIAIHMQKMFLSPEDAISHDRARTCRLELRASTQVLVVPFLS